MVRSFIYSIIITIALLFVFAEVATPIVQPKQAVHTLPIHKTLYLERGIYDEEFYHILAATMEWNEATNGQVVFDIKRLPSRNINISDAIVILNVSPDYPQVILLDNVNHMTTLGYYEGNEVIPYIALIDERIKDQDETAVIMHELGHALGLQHPNSQDPNDPVELQLLGANTLMFSSIDLGASHITTFDLKQFCKLYHCDWKKLHGVPEVQ